jgi:hypothetical protein
MVAYLLAYETPSICQALELPGPGVAASLRVVWLKPCESGIPLGSGRDRAGGPRAAAVGERNHLDAAEVAYLTNRIIMLPMTMLQGHDDDFLREVELPLPRKRRRKYKSAKRPRARPGFCNPAKKIEDMLNVPAATPWKT